MRRRDFIVVLSGAVALPLTAGAQEPGRSYRIAYLALLPGEDATLAKPFLERLRELGYNEGKNITWTYRSADGRPERLPQLAAAKALGIDIPSSLLAIADEVIE
jgi:putative ABC transport system substrate-binding protein